MANADLVAGKIRAMLADRKNVSEKKMFGGTAFMLGGKMCIGTLKGDIVVRVGPERNDEALAMPGARPMDFTGKPMKGFVFVRMDALSDPALAKWLEMSTEYVSTLKKKSKSRNNRASR
jgi:TfoX/Sxy family transcriptional regulator of competence genes